MKKFALSLMISLLSVIAVVSSVLAASCATCGYQPRLPKSLE